MASQIAKVAETIKIVIDSQLCKQSNQTLILILMGFRHFWNIFGSFHWLDYNNSYWDKTKQRSQHQK